MIKRMLDWGPVLTGRHLGKEVRLQILDGLNNEEVLILDFDGVESASHSFCDEAFGKIILDVPASGVIKKLRFANVKPSIKAAVICVLNERLKSQKTAKMEQNIKPKSKTLSLN